MVFGHMDHKFRSKTTDSHASYIGVWDHSLYPAEQAHKGIVGQYVVEIPIS